MAHVTTWKDKKGVKHRLQTRTVAYVTVVSIDHNPEFGSELREESFHRRICKAVFEIGGTILSSTFPEIREMYKKKAATRKKHN